MPEYVEYIEELRASGQTGAAGDTVCVTPSAGMRLRVFYLSYNPAAPVEAAFKFGASGAPFLRNKVNGGSVIAKDSNAFRYLQGGLNESLILNLSDFVTTDWNCFYIEVP